MSLKWMLRRNDLVSAVRTMNDSSLW